MTIPISAELLIAINKEFGGEGSGVIDMNGVEANASRPFASFGGVESFPTIWDKAGALLHGVASTQTFRDGNKRTAILATLYFLEQNGEALRNLPRITKEAAVLSVATNLMDAKDASDWLFENRLRAEDRVDYAVLGNLFGASVQRNTKPSQWSYQIPVQGITLPDGMDRIFLGLSARLHWFPVDEGATKRVSVRIRESRDSPYAIQDEGSHVAVVGTVDKLWDNPVFPNGFQSWNECFLLAVDVLGRGQNWFELMIDGEVAWSESFTVERRMQVPDLPI